MGDCYGGVLIVVLNEGVRGEDDGKGLDDRSKTTPNKYQGYFL